MVQDFAGSDQAPAVRTARLQVRAARVLQRIFYLSFVDTRWDMSGESLCRNLCKKVSAHRTWKHVSGETKKCPRKSSDISNKFWTLQLISKPKCARHSNKTSTYFNAKWNLSLECVNSTCWWTKRFENSKCPRKEVVVTRCCTANGDWENNNFQNAIRAAVRDQTEVVEETNVKLYMRRK